MHNKNLPVPSSATSSKLEWSYNKTLELLPSSRKLLNHTQSSLGISWCTIQVWKLPPSCGKLLHLVVGTTSNKLKWCCYKTSEDSVVTFIDLIFQCLQGSITKWQNTRGVSLVNVGRLLNFLLGVGNKLKRNLGVPSE